MSHLKIPEHVRRHCDRCGYCEPFLHEGWWWAYPANGVMPVPLSVSVSPRRWLAERLATYSGVCFGVALGMLIGGGCSWLDDVIAGGFAVMGGLLSLLGRCYFG